MENLPEIERIKRTYQSYADGDLSRRLWSANNPGNRAIVTERKSSLDKIVQMTGLLSSSDLRILDIGCGNGDVLASYLIWGVEPDNLYGIDLLPERVDAANRRYPAFHIQQGNAEHLAFPDEHFDMVSFFTVFSSILDTTMRQNIAMEVSRVVKPGGAIIWYDFRYRNPLNPNTRPMKRSDISDLFPEFTLNLVTTTLLPPLARRLGRLTDSLYPMLSAIPFLRTHYIGLLMKPVSVASEGQ